MPASETKLVKTCQNCVRAKIRCLRTAGASGCDRCRRLNKDCYFRPTRSRCNPANKDTRIEALEAKVEQLIAQSGTVIRAPPSSDRSPITPGSDHPTEGAFQDVIGHGIISVDEADSLVATYRRTLAPQFPFVVLSPDMTLPRMREERPVLLLAILMVSLRRSDHRSDHCKELEGLFNDAIAERLIFTQSHSLDVLQGLLVAQAWSHHRSDWLSCSTPLHLAQCIIGDLQFDKLSGVGILRSRINMNECVSRADGSPMSLINEKKRAVIGCLMLSSCRSTILQKDHAKTRLPYVDRYASELADASEYPSDAWLVHIVRIQHIMERVDEAVTAADSSDAELVIQRFYAEIDAYKAILPEEVNENSEREINIIFKIHLYTLELFVCQGFLFDNNSSIFFPVLSTKQQASEPGPLRQTRGHSGLNLTSSQTSLLGRGLSAAKGILDFYLAQSPVVYHQLNYMQWLQSGFNIVLACKLAVTASNYASQNPHIKTLCSTLDMPKILRGLLDTVHILDAQQPRVDWKPPARSFYVQWIERIQNWFEQRYQSNHLEISCISGDMSGGNDSSAPYMGGAPSSWDAAPVYNANMSQDSEIGDWPDFIWNVTMEDIFMGPTDNDKIPFDMNETWI